VYVTESSRGSGIRFPPNSPALVKTIFHWVARVNDAMRSFTVIVSVAGLPFAALGDFTNMNSPVVSYLRRPGQFPGQLLLSDQRFARIVYSDGNGDRHRWIADFGCDRDFFGADCSRGITHYGTIVP